MTHTTKYAILNAEPAHVGYEEVVMARSESTIRVNLSPEKVYRILSDVSRFGDFTPNVIRVRKSVKGAHFVTLNVGNAEEETHIVITGYERSRRLAWRSTSGARWNGEFILRPTGSMGDGCEIRFIVDYEPRSMAVDPALRKNYIPTWDVGGTLLAFKNFAEMQGYVPRTPDLAEAEIEAC